MKKQNGNLKFGMGKEIEEEKHDDESDLEQIQDLPLLEDSVVYSLMEDATQKRKQKKSLNPFHDFKEITKAKPDEPMPWIGTVAPKLSSQ